MTINTLFQTGVEILNTSSNEKDKKIALEFLKIASLHKKSEANLYLGQYYQFVDIQPHLSFNYFYKGSLNYDVKCIYQLSQLYKYGHGCSKNLNKYIELLLILCDLDINYAEHELGLFYLNDQKFYSPTLGFIFLELAANNNHYYAQFDLANCYLCGEGTPVNQKKAIFWFYQAAKNNISEAYFKLYEILKNSEPEISIICLKISSTLNNLKAKNLINYLKYDNIISSEEKTKLTLYFSHFN